MNFYPAEVVTPPLALVALLGRPDLHPAAGEFLRSRHKPPINSIGVAEPASAARLFGVAFDPQQLKAGWLTRPRSPSAAAHAVTAVHLCSRVSGQYGDCWKSRHDTAGEQKHSTEPAGPDTGIIKVRTLLCNRTPPSAACVAITSPNQVTGVLTRHTRLLLLGTAGQLVCEAPAAAAGGGGGVPGPGIRGGGPQRLVPRLRGARGGARGRQASRRPRRGGHRAGEWRCSEATYRHIPKNGCSCAASCWFGFTM
jgi:hypothetical protein